MSSEITGCKSCNGCQGCNDCEKCNTKCQVTCNKDNLQTYCKQGKETYSKINGYSFSWNKCTKKGEIIGPGYFDQDEWDRIISYINKARSKGDPSTGGTISLSSKSNVAPFSAKEFNRVSNKINSIEVEQDKVIYGSYFDSLETAASAMKISKNACDGACNAKCNGGCDACQSCNKSCNGSCNGSRQAEYYYGCCGCDGHESCNETSTCDTTCLIYAQRGA